MRGSEQVKAPTSRQAILRWPVFPCNSYTEYNKVNSNMGAAKQSHLDGYEQNKPSDDDEERAKIRRDLIQRLFAVAISVGFAAAVNKMVWIKDSVAFGKSDALHGLVIITALYATVLSWDGYLLSITKKPLYDFTRFALDICLVFVYMFMLMTSDRPYYWMYILCGIFTLYITWDILTVRRHYNSYVDVKIEPKYQSKVSISKVLRVYVGGALNKAGIKRGPIITLVWALYFYAMTAISTVSLIYAHYTSCVFAAAGLYLYRRDKSGGRSTGQDGFGMIVRIFLAATLLIVMTFIYFDVCSFFAYIKTHYADWLSF